VTEDLIVGGRRPPDPDLREAGRGRKEDVRMGRGLRGRDAKVEDLADLTGELQEDVREGDGGMIFADEDRIDATSRFCRLRSN